MNKYLKIICFLLSVPLLALLGFCFYLAWPSFFPKHAIGSCVEDTQVHRIHKIIGIEDRLKGSGIPTIVLQSGLAISGTHEPGTKESIFLEDTHIKSINCP